MADILIGNVRGPQGEPGPVNRLLAQTYQFCESDDGNTIPSGPWVSRLEDIEKGKWYWCRNTMTWESGPETVLYSVGYVGNDGTFNGIESVEAMGARIDALENRITPISKGGTESSTIEGAQAKLGITELKRMVEEKVTGINDLTTGINLIRGTRDFRVGTGESFIDGGKNYYFNGFTNDGFNFSSKDTDGFTIASCSQSGLSSDAVKVIYGPLVKVEVGETYTLSLDCMIDDIGSFTSSPIIVCRAFDSAGKYIENISSIDSNKVTKSKEWVTLKQTITPSKSNTVYIQVYGRLQRNGSINLRKLDFVHGDIKNPIWSESPFDVETFNDETTGINLLRGTRDFVQGTEKLLSNSSLDYQNGCYRNTAFTFEVDDDGYTNAVIKRTGKTSIEYNRLAASSIPLDRGIATFTFSFEFKSENISAIDNDSIGVIEVFEKATMTRKFVTDCFLSLLRPENKRDDVWNRFVKVSTIPNTYLTSDYFIRFSVWLPLNGSIRFRKMMAQYGAINHPIWAASPFDTEYINDETTSINLIRGTRDFVLGTQKYTNMGAATVYTDGFSNQNNAFTFEKDEKTGFTVATSNNASNILNLRSSAYLGVEGDQTYTFSFEMMVDTVPNESFDLFNFQYVSADGSTSIVNNYKRAGDVGLSNCAANVWHKVVFSTTIPKEKIVDGGFLIGVLLTPKGRKISYRKPTIQAGIVNNPAWAASPFDLASSYEWDNGVPALLGKIPEQNIITQAVDLNTMVTPGVYCTSSNAIAQQCQNIPSNYGDKGTFKLTVAYMRPTVNNLNNIVQTLEEYNGSQKWVRYRLTSGSSVSFTSWVQVKDSGGLVPITGGGTGASTLAGAKQNLGITTLEEKVNSAGFTEYDISSLVTPTSEDFTVISAKARVTNGTVCQISIVGKKNSGTSANAMFSPWTLNEKINSVSGAAVGGNQRIVGYYNSGNRTFEVFTPNPLSNAFEFNLCTTFILKTPYHG